MGYRAHGGSFVEAHKDERPFVICYHTHVVTSCSDPVYRLTFVLPCVVASSVGFAFELEGFRDARELTLFTSTLSHSPAFSNAYRRRGFAGTLSEPPDAKRACLLTGRKVE